MIPGVISFKKQPDVKSLAKDLIIETAKVKEEELRSLTTIEGIRKERDRLISETMWVKEKYECQLREKQAGMSAGADISQKKFEEWLLYWKTLRNLPNRIENKEVSIESVVFPKQPI